MMNQVFIYIVNRSRDFRGTRPVYEDIHCHIFYGHEIARKNRRTRLHREEWDTLKCHLQNSVGRTNTSGSFEVGLVGFDRGEKLQQVFGTFGQLEADNVFQRLLRELG